MGAHAVPPPSSGTQHDHTAQQCASMPQAALATCPGPGPLDGCGVGDPQGDQQPTEELANQLPSGGHLLRDGVAEDEDGGGDDHHALHAVADGVGDRGHALQDHVRHLRVGGGEGVGHERGPEAGGAVSTCGEHLRWLHGPPCGRSTMG